MKSMKRYTNRLLLLLFLVMATNSVFAQQFYPVHATVQVLPPHGLHLSDYYSGTRDRLVVTLFNRDFDRPFLTVRLRVTVRNGNHFMIRSRDELPAPVITLMPGVPLRLTSADLAPYLMPNRVTMQGHLQNGKLPTGMTEFIVEVLDHATGRVLSQEATGRAWLELHQPPQLNLPEQGTDITFRTPQHIRFQWFPRHTAIAQTVYEFTLRELPDNDVPPQAAFMFGNTIYQTQTRFTTLNLTHLQPLLEPGRRYAWQVRAMAMDGIDEIGMFANHGFSEVGWFRVNDNCPPPMNVRAEVAYRRMTIRWQPQHQHQSFVVQYRQKTSNEFFDWTSIETTGSETTIIRLRADQTYEYRVGALCPNMREFVFSDIGYVRLPAYDAQRLANCGNAPIIDRENRTPIEQLRPGDMVTIGGDFPMTVLEAMPLGDGWFSGRGYTTITWVFDIDIAVRFDRLRVNTDLQQIGGRVISEYDPNWGQIADLTRPQPPQDGGGIIFELNFTLPDIPVMTFNPETGELIILGADGTPHTINVPRNEQGEPVFPFVIIDEQGREFEVHLAEESITDKPYRELLLLPITEQNAENNRTPYFSVLVRYEDDRFYTTIGREPKELVFTRTNRAHRNLTIRRSWTGPNTNMHQIEAYWYVNDESQGRSSVLTVDLSQIGVHDIVVRGGYYHSAHFHNNSTTDVLVSFRITVADANNPVIRVNPVEFNGRFGFDVGTYLCTRIRSMKNYQADAYMALIQGESVNMIMNVANTIPNNYNIELRTSSNAITVYPKEFTGRQLGNGGARFSITPISETDNRNLYIYGRANARQEWSRLYTINYSVRNRANFEERRLRLFYVITSGDGVVNNRIDAELRQSIDNHLNNQAFNQAFTEWIVEFDTIDIRGRIENSRRRYNMRNRFWEICGGYTEPERSNKLRELLRSYGYGYGDGGAFVAYCAIEFRLASRIDEAGGIDNRIIHDLYEMYKYGSYFLAFVFSEDSFSNSGAPASAMNPADGFGSIYLLPRVRNNLFIFTHELGHNLGLRHPYEIGVQSRETTNFMNHQFLPTLTLNMFWKWQWRDIRNAPNPVSPTRN